MVEDSLTRLLNGRFPNPDGEGMLPAPQTRVWIAPSLAGNEAQCLGALRMGERLGVVSDPATDDALGGRVAEALRSDAFVERIRFDHAPHADLATAESIARAASACDALVAVGAGTINDLVKYASAALGKPYAVFGTAPSMNGYTSANAAITEHGHKKSIPCQVPVGALFDLDVLCEAPVRMIQAGLGDSLCRSTAQVDWLLAHTILNEPYRKAPFALLREDEEALMKNPAALVNGDREAMEHLIRTLALSGFGMTLCGSSRPASQGEHLISHYIDMMRTNSREVFLHGEQIAVTTLTMAELQQSMLERPAPLMLPTMATRETVLEHFGDTIGEECWTELLGKRVERPGLNDFNQRIAGRWQSVREAARSVWHSPMALREALAAAGCPLTPAAIGCSEIFYRDAVLHARELRNRYTFLDLGSDTSALSLVLPQAGK